MEESRKVYGWLARGGNAAVGCSTMWTGTRGGENYCGNLLWQSSLTLLFPMKQLVFLVCGFVVSASCLGATNNVVLLGMTSNAWGKSSREYRAATVSALSEARQQGVGSDVLCGWFTNMVAYACPDTSFEVWTGEKRFMIGMGTGIPEIVSSLDCWLSVADYYGELKGLRVALSEDTTRVARFAFLTNENMTAYYAALDDEKKRLGKYRVVGEVMPGISNVVLSSFPSVILPRLAAGERLEMVSNIAERAGLTEAEVHLLEGYYDDNGNTGSN